MKKVFSVILAVMVMVMATGFAALWPAPASANSSDSIRIEARVGVSTGLVVTPTESGPYPYLKGVYVSRFKMENTGGEEKYFFAQWTIPSSSPIPSYWDAWTSIRSRGVELNPGMHPYQIFSIPPGGNYEITLWARVMTTTDKNNRGIILTSYINQVPALKFLLASADAPGNVTIRWHTDGNFSSQSVWIAINKIGDGFLYGRNVTDTGSYVFTGLPNGIYYFYISVGGISVGARHTSLVFVP